jgi:hypothetical protein
MNNPTIMNSEQYNSYYSGLNSSVEHYKLTNPEKYEIAQAIGNDMMSLSYDLESGIDMKGSCLRCKNLLVSIYQYGLEKEDLYEGEYDLLHNVLVFRLNCLKEVDEIFSENEYSRHQDILNRCMQILDKKIKELSNDN